MLNKNLALGLCKTSLISKSLSVGQISITHNFLSLIDMMSRPITFLLFLWTVGPKDISYFLLIYPVKHRNQFCSRWVKILSSELKVNGIWITERKLILNVEISSKISNPGERMLGQIELPCTKLDMLYGFWCCQNQSYSEKKKQATW